MCGIYTITCKINGRKYVRSTDNNKERWGKHLTQLRGNYHHSFALQRDYNKYGEEAFVFEMVEECKSEERLKLEQKYLDENESFFYPLGYNISHQATNCVLYGEANGMYGKRGKDNPNYGRKNTEETKKRMSESNKGIPKSAECKKKLSEAAKKRYQERPECFKGGWQYISEENQKLIAEKKSIPVYQVSKKENVFIKQYPSAIIAEKETGIDNSTIGKVCAHKPHSNTAGRYKWYFEEEFYSLVEQGQIIIEENNPL